VAVGSRITTLRLQRLRFFDIDSTRQQCSALFFAITTRARRLDLNRWPVCCAKLVKPLTLLFLLIVSFNTNATNKVALVIGNSQYQHAEHLPVPANDAQAVAKQLRKLGFKTIEGIDVTKGEMKSLLRRFSKKLTNETVALFYYAGHGIQRDGKNYLIPINADIKKAYELEDAGMDLRIVLQAFNEVKPRLAIALIDACRDNPFEKNYQDLTRGIKLHGSGLADMRQSAGGTILSYATEPGKTAIDGYGKHSPYTAALLKYINVPGLSVHDMLNEVGLDVLKATDQEQKPWVASSPVGRFCFAGCENQIPQLAKVNQRTTADSLKLAMQTGDLPKIEQLVYLNKQQNTFLQRLFSSYTSFSVKISTTKRTRSTQGRYRSPKASVKILEAVNHKGNRVIPSKKWNTISLTFR